jgi:hypothetical protein
VVKHLQFELLTQTWQTFVEKAWGALSQFGVVLGYVVQQQVDISTTYELICLPDEFTCFWVWCQIATTVRSANKIAK